MNLIVETGLYWDWSFFSTSLTEPVRSPRTFYALPRPNQLLVHSGEGSCVLPGQPMVQQGPLVYFLQGTNSCHKAKGRDPQQMRGCFWMTKGSSILIFGGCYTALSQNKIRSLKSQLHCVNYTCVYVCVCNAYAYLYTHIKCIYVQLTTHEPGPLLHPIAAFDLLNKGPNKKL